MLNKKYTHVSPWQMHLILRCFIFCSYQLFTLLFDTDVKLDAKL